MPITDRLAVNRALAHTQCITCSRCGTKQSYVIERRRTWFRLLRVPLFPLATGYRYYCPGCKNSHPLAKQQAKYMMQRANPSAK